MFVIGPQLEVSRRDFQILDQEVEIFHGRQKLRGVSGRLSADRAL